MKKDFKHILPVLICMVLLLSPFALLIVGAVEANNWQTNPGGNVVWLQSGQTYAYRANVLTSFRIFQIMTVTGGEVGEGGSCEMHLYHWNTDYATTTASEPIASLTIDSLKDNTVQPLYSAGANDTSRFLGAGEYLVTVQNTTDASNTTARVGVQGKNNGEAAVGLSYLDGEETRNHDAKVHLFVTSAADEVWGTCVPSQLPHLDREPAVNGSNAKVLSFTTSVGVRHHVAAAFSGVNFLMATFKNSDIQIRMSVYEWKGSYDDTVAEAPVATDTLTMSDNAVQGISFDSLPAGDYLFLAHEPTATAGMYYHSTVDAYEGVVYREGYVSEASMSIYPRIHVIFNEDLGDEPYFLPCENPEVGVTGDHVSPPEAELPADSLINTHPVMPDTWVFTDGLGRVSLTNADVGDPREDKTVGMFYWTWHIDFQATKVPTTLQDLSVKYPEAMNDWDHDLWSTTTGTYFWNKPIYGFYRSDDEWVLRRQAELLTNAGVDVIFADNTNGSNTWKNAYTALFNTWAEAKEAGTNTPKISFVLPFSANDGSRQQFNTLYRDIYRVNLWQDQWFYWDGKPLIVGHNGNLSADTSATEKEILNFFTFRQNNPSHLPITASKMLGWWGWLATYPQASYYVNRTDIGSKTVEQISVGVAVNHDYVENKTSAMNGANIIGRSYTTAYPDRYLIEGAEASKWGYQFAEQFNYALKTNPKLIFVTGWNEWLVGRYENWDAGGVNTENAFPDQFNDEYSRDIEPTKGALQDHYYYQLVNYIRQYKGVNPIPTPSEKVTIDLSAGNEQWTSVEPYYGAYIGNTEDRDAQGYGELVYTETSGRNDIIGAQIARDDEYVYFHVECAENITPYTDNLWMNLYIDCTGDGALDGWNSFDYVLNKTAPTATTAVLEKFTGNGYASEKVTDAEYTVDGRYMTVKIAKSDLGLSGDDLSSPDDYTINFAWTDNVHDEGNDRTFSGDILDFYISGDVAPGGRFKYSYISTAENAGVGESESTVVTDPTTESDSRIDGTDPMEPVTENDTAVSAESESIGDTQNDDERGCQSSIEIDVILVVLLLGLSVGCLMPLTGRRYNRVRGGRGTQI